MIDDTAHDGPTTTVHGPTEVLEDVLELLERGGWTVLSATNGGPDGHVTVLGDHPLIEHLTGPPFGYRLDYEPKV